MTEQENVCNELLLNRADAASESPTYEEGGGENARGHGDITADAAMAYDDNAGGVFTTLPSAEAAELPSLQGLLESLNEAKFICGGQPSKLTPNLKSKVCMLLCVGLSRRQAATMLDIDQATISHAAQRDPDFGRALVRAEEFSQLRPHLAIAAAGLRDWRAAAWFLTHQQKSPKRPSPERSAELHQLNIQQTRQRSELAELEDILREQRNAAQEQRDKAQKLLKQAEKQAEFEANNPHLFRKKKKTAKKAAG